MASFYWYIIVCYTIHKMKSLEFNKPHMLVVIGLPGAGKTFFARQFGETFGAPFVDYTHFHRLTGSIELGDIVATELLGQLFLTKQTILIEGRGETAQDRAMLTKHAKSKGYEILYVWVQTDPQVAKKRAVHSKDANYKEEEFLNASQAFAPLTPADPQVVISGRHTYASQLRMVLKRIVSLRSDPKRPATPHTVQKRTGKIIVG